MRKYVYAVLMGLVPIFVTGSPLPDDLPIYYLTSAASKQMSLS